VSLVGHFVVVTRAASQAGPLVAALERRGAAVVLAPTIDVVQRGNAAAEVAAGRVGADWIVVASVNALDVITEPATNLAIVGETTAAAARRLGHSVALVAPDGTAASLVSSLPPPPRTGASVLVVQGSAAMAVVTEGIAALGWRITVVTAYDTVTAPRLDHLMPRIGSSSAIVFTSPSTVTNFVSMYSVDLAPPVVVAIGPTTARACEQAGLIVAEVAHRRSPEGIADACEKALAA
jgi:uroporphyrinogen-III synthase